MQPYQALTGLVLPIDRPNVDTDAIIPKQFLKSIKRSGFGPNLFDEWRYLDKGEPGKDNAARPLNHEFVLNQPRYAGAEILLARSNFGCGSSREHAPWAFDDFGIRTLIAPSFADIFFSNSCKNGLLPVTLSEQAIDELFEEVASQPGYQLSVDLEAQTVTTPAGRRLTFEFDAGLKRRLLEGLDDIALTLNYSEEIQAYESKRKLDSPWLFD